MLNKPSISDYYRKLLEEARSEILRESEEQILGSDTEDLTKYYLEKYSLSPIVLDEKAGASWEHENYVKTIPAHQRERFHSNGGDIDWQCERIKVEMPVEFNKDIDILSKLMSSTYSFSFSEDEFLWSPEKISFVIKTKGYGFNYDEDRIAKEINSGIGKIKQFLEWKNADIAKENNNMLNQIRGLIEGRKNDIKKNKQTLISLTQKINIPLRKKENPSLQRIHIDQKPIVNRIKPSPKLPEEYVLDEDKVFDIITVLDGQAKTFEKTPNTIAKLDEESLRDLLLANLNSIFDGKATGETFSKNGKTDIYLNIDKGKILIFECKIWGGKQLYLRTINQLRGYLTWRQNYGVLINFVKLKNFTRTLAEIESIVKESPSYRNDFRKINETHFVSKHVLEDEEKEVIIHHLFYNL